jgi:hypothetical protein
MPYPENGTDPNTDQPVSSEKNNYNNEIKFYFP